MEAIEESSDTGNVDSFFTFCACLGMWIPFSLTFAMLYIQGSELLMFAILSSVSLYIAYPLQTLLIVSWSLALVVETQNFLHDYRSPLLAVQGKFIDKVKTLAADFVEIKTNDDDSMHLCLGSTSSRGENVDWTKFFKLSQHVWTKTCLGLVTSDKGSFSGTEQHKGLDNVHYVRFVLQWLDVRPDDEVNKTSTKKKLQKNLWVRCLKGLIRLLILVLLFLSLVMILLAFNSLWKDPNPKDTNSLLLTILIVPMYTFVRTKLSGNSVTDDEKLLLEKVLDVELEKCLRDSIERVSPRS